MNPDETLKRYAQWLPGHPHLGMVRHILSTGWAHVEEDSDGVPYLINMHGGRIPLADVKWDPEMGGSEMRSSSRKNGNQLGTVCDTLDEMNRSFGEKDDVDISALLDDIEDMYQRMARREKEMQDAIKQVHKSILSCPQVDEKGSDEFSITVQSIRDSLKESYELEAMEEKAEILRTNAAMLEKRLHDYRSIALDLNEIYESMKGARYWDRETIRKEECE